MIKPPKVDADEQAAMERMERALKAALSTPPTKHKDEPKRTKVYSGPKSRKEK